jgi:hypothetical protein
MKGTAIVTNLTEPRASVDPRPTLLCLNLRQEHVYGRRLVEVAQSLIRASEVLAEFRAHGWPVVHAYTLRLREPGIEHGALAGFEPQVDEPVFAVTKLSALSDPQIFGVSSGQSIRLVGGAVSRSGLAALLAAQDHGCRIGVIPSACFAPSVEALPESSFYELIHADEDGALGVLKTEWGGNVICLHSRRH